jgi:hypothetical protein
MKKLINANRQCKKDIQAAALSILGMIAENLKNTSRYLSDMGGKTSSAVFQSCKKTER